MSNVLRLAIVDPDDSSREALKGMLLGMDTIWLEAECSRYEFFADVIGQTKPDVGMVVLDQDPDKALRLVGDLGRSVPDCSVLRSGFRIGVPSGSKPPPDTSGHLLHYIHYVSSEAISTTCQLFRSAFLAPNA